MKKACTLLLLLVFSVYFYDGFNLFKKYRLTEKTTGSISDIAEKVVAIPLGSTGNIRLDHIDRIKKDGSHLFLLSNRQLYHFDESGRFVGRVTNQQGEDIAVSDYVVDTVHKRLIVVGNRQDIYHYTYSGELIDKQDFKESPLWSRLHSLSFYNEMIWAVVEKQVRSKDDPTVCHVEKLLCKYTTDFLELESRTLTPARLGREYDGYFDPEIGVDEEGVYAYTPSMEPNKILKDTLYLLQWKGLFASPNSIASIYPLRMGERFFFSSYYNQGEDPATFTFCYDKAENTAYLVPGGFQDDVYRTGRISKLQSVDIFSRTLCFTKSGEELGKAFPSRKESDNPVVFIVHLKA